MAKYYGAVGYGVLRSEGLADEAIVDTDVVTDLSEHEESLEHPDVCQEYISERNYYGDVFKDSRQLEKGHGVNDNVKVNNRISIVADAFAFEHFFDIRYVVWMGVRWKVSDVEVQRPRLILSIGGVYNGPEKDAV